MADLDIFDEDYGDIFITQEARDECKVSLEEEDNEQDEYLKLKSQVTKLKRRAIGVVSGIGKGRIRKFNSVSDEKMMEITYEARSEAKICWAIKAYRELRNMRLDRDDCEEEIVFSDLDDLCGITKERLEFTLCRFIVEVRKSTTDEDYPGRTLYQMACCIQNHLKKNNLNWKLVHGSEFCDFNRVLDRVMQERAAQCIVTVRRQAQVISLEFEDQLWKNNILGKDTPDKLRSTVLYILGVNCALRAGDEHYSLRRPGGCTSSQLSFEENLLGVRCLVYREHTVTKTNKGGLRDMKKECKIVWIKPNKNVTRCPVRTVEKYLKLLPEGGVKPNLYLHSLRKPKPTVWYCETPLGINKVRGVVKDMLKDAGLDGFFTNHSLRRTAATRLFQAGQNVKLIKEVTGHISNAVEKYETTSDEQRMEISRIIQGQKEESNKAISLNKSETDRVVEIKGGVNDEDFVNGEVVSVVRDAVRKIGNKKARITVHIDLVE